MCARWYRWVNYSSYTIACLFSPPPPTATTATTTKSIGRIEHVTTLRKWAFQQNCQQSNIIELASLISFYWLSVSMRFLQVYFACYYGVPVLGKYYLCSSSFALLHISPFVLILATSLKLLLFFRMNYNRKWEMRTIRSYKLNDLLFHQNYPTLKLYYLHKKLLVDRKSALSKVSIFQ